MSAKKAHRYEEKLASEGKGGVSDPVATMLLRAAVVMTTRAQPYRALPELLMVV